MSIIRCALRAAWAGVILAGSLRGQYFVEAPRFNYALPRASYGGLTPDINASGLPDYLSLGPGSVIYAWLDPGLGVVGPPTSITLSGVPPNPVTLYSWGSVALITRDSQADIIALDSAVGMVRVLTGVPSPPYFTPQSSTIGGANTLLCAYADVNGDGWTDLVRGQSGPAGAAPYDLVVYANNYPQWPMLAQIATPRAPLSATFGDYDGDGYQDLAVVVNGVLGVSSNPSFDEVMLFFGNGTGSFAPPVFQSTSWLAPLSQTLPGFLIADIDGDGCVDMYRGTSGGPGSSLQASIRVLWGSPSRVMTPGPIITVPGAVGYQIPELMDIDGDGLEDVGFRDANSPQVHFFRVLHNNGNRSFGPAVQTLGISIVGNIGQGFHPVFTRADFDMDGDLDMMGHSPTQVHYYINEAVYARGCAGTGGKVPRSTPGTAFLGSQGSAFYLEDALPQAPALFGISVARNPLGVFPCGIGIDFFGPASFIPRMTDATGFAAVPITIPGWSGLQGAQFSIQWAVADPAGGFTGSTTNIALSEARTVYIW